MKRNTTTIAAKYLIANSIAKETNLSRQYLDSYYYTAYPINSTSIQSGLQRTLAKTRRAVGLGLRYARCPWCWLQDQAHSYLRLCIPHLLRSHLNTYTSLGLPPPCRGAHARCMYLSPELGMGPWTRGSISMLWIWLIDLIGFGIYHQLISPYLCLCS